MLVRVATACAPWVIFPVLVSMIGTVAILGPDLDLTAVGVPDTAREVVLFATAFPLFYALVAALERWLPYRPEWNRPHGDVRTDVAHLVFTGIGTSELIKIVWYGAAFAAAAWLSRALGGRLWPLHWPRLAQLGLALLLAELGHYWFHRLSHERALVWRLHATHHSAPRLYWLNATRFHPGDLFALIVCQTAPLILLGADTRALLSYGLFTGVYGQLQHSNIALRTVAPLRWLLSTPDLHRWHHSTDPRQGNNNYGAVLSAWDLVFGTYFFPADRAFTGRVGLHDLPRFPRRYLGQLLSPVRWNAARDLPAAERIVGAR